MKDWHLPYRDSLEGVQTRIADLRHQIAEKERTLTTTFWELIKQKYGENVRPLQEQSNQTGRTMEECSRIEQALENHLSLIVQAIQDAPNLHREWTSVPHRFPNLGRRRTLERRYSQNGPYPLSEAQSAHKSVSLYLERRCQKVEYDPIVYDHLRAQFHYHDSPMILETVFDYHSPYLILTSMPQCTPRIVVRKRTMFSGLFARFTRKMSNAFTANTTFHDFFSIEDPQESGMSYLTKGLQTRLLIIARYDIPTLKLEPGFAAISWNYSFSMAAMDAAIRTLHGLREVPTNIKLLHEP
jgi:hypothetical protein